MFGGKATRPPASPALEDTKRRRLTSIFVCAGTRDLFKPFEVAPRSANVEKSMDGLGCERPYDNTCWARRRIGTAVVERQFETATLGTHQIEFKRQRQSGLGEVRLKIRGGRAGCTTFEVCFGRRILRSGCAISRKSVVKYGDLSRHGLMLRHRKSRPGGEEGGGRGKRKGEGARVLSK